MLREGVGQDGDRKWGSAVVLVWETKRDGRGRMVSSLSLKGLCFFDIPGEDRMHLFSKAKNKDNRLASGRQHYFAMLIGHSSKENVLIWLLQLKENNFQKFVGSHSVGFLFILFLLDPWISFIKIQILQRRNIFEKFLWLKMLGNCM